MALTALLISCPFLIRTSVPRDGIAGSLEILILQESSNKLIQTGLSNLQCSRNRWCDCCAAAEATMPINDGEKAAEEDASASAALAKLPAEASMEDNLGRQMSWALPELPSAASIL